MPGHAASPLPGFAAIEIPFPPPGVWMEDGQNLDLGPFRQGLCRGNLFKTRDNKLYVYVEVMTWGDCFVKADMPLRVPAEDEGVSTLHIHWRDTGVRLRQDDYPAIEAGWHQPRQRTDPSL